MDPPAVRLTVLHADDVPGRPRATDMDVSPGTTAAVLREEVARLTGRSEWLSRHRAMTADGVRVEDTHPVGLPPLLPGCVVALDGTDLPGSARSAAVADRHLAVVAGPDCGALLPLTEARPSRVGPGTSLPVRDDSWDPSARLLVRVRHRPPMRSRRTLGEPARCVVQVRVEGPATALQSARRPNRWRRLSRLRWVRMRPGEAIRIGTSVLELRDATVRLTSEVTSPGDSSGRRSAQRPSAHRGGPPGAGRSAALVVSTAGSLVTGLVLAVAVHQPLLALTALTGPLLWWANRRSPSTVDAAPREEVHPTVGDVAALRLATVLHSDEVRVPAPWDDGGSLAVVGPRAHVLGAARAVVLGEVGSRGGCEVTVEGHGVADWTWLVWAAGACVHPPAERSAGALAARRALVVVDSPDDALEVARWRARAPSSARLLWLATDLGGVPAWCGAVLSVGTGSAVLRSTGRPPRTVPLVGVRADTAEAHCREIARTSEHPKGFGEPASTQTSPALGRCPDSVALGSLPCVPPPDAAAVCASWARPRRGLVTTFGEGPGGVPVALDLVRDGPHAVVAGTTGAGKSELLTTLVLGLALTYPPERLAVLLVDFKGGTGLPGLASLPHVVGRLSDLDAAGARRVLLGLGAELRRRERIVAQAGLRDVEELPATGAGGGPPLPRLLVVIDEFRALADDLPELLPGLGRLAAQGRSLGVHLVLATQRPAGAVPTELRANVSLRIALRVLDPADSVDLVGVPDAAHVDATTPGRAVVQRGGGTGELVQVARAVLGDRHGPVRLARPAADVLGGRGGTSWTPDVPRTGAQDVDRWVSAARAAAADRPAPSLPWLPELPAHVDARSVPAGPGLAVALSDLPQEQRRGAVRWDPDEGHLLVLGGPGSGRTTALVAVGRAALDAGRDVHAVGLPPQAAAALRSGDPVGLGTVVPSHDPVTTARLLDALARARAGARRPVLLVDGLDQVLDTLGDLARGAGAGLLTALWQGGEPAASVVAAAPVSAASSRLLGAFRDRLVLGVADPSSDALAGVPTAYAGARTVPGRAVHLRGTHAALCQVALPATTTATSAGPRRTGRPRLSPPPSLAPSSPPPAHQGDDGRLLVPVGLGADDVGVVHVDVADAFVLVGPPGSGRTTLLHGLATALGPLDAPVLLLSAHQVGDRAPDRSAHTLDVLARSADAIVLLDDVDELERAEPEVAHALVERLTAHRRTPRSSTFVVVATTATTHAVAAYRGLVPALLRSRRLLCLEPREPGSLDLLGAHGRWLVEPTGGPPGRAVLRRDRALVPVQVWGPASP